MIKIPKYVILLLSFLSLAFTSCATRLYRINEDSNNMATKKNEVTLTANLTTTGGLQGVASYSPFNHISFTASGFALRSLNQY